MLLMTVIFFITVRTHDRLCHNPFKVWFLPHLHDAAGMTFFCLGFQ